MKRNLYYQSLFILCSGLILFLASCKKDNKEPATGSATSTGPIIPKPVGIGLYEADSSIYKLLFISVPKIGNKTVDEFLIFDTGSGGMVIDAHELLPTSMVSNSGITFTGDSTTVNGITITNQKATIQYGADSTTSTIVYGNLAYANVTIGDVGSGNVTVKRLPFFLYYRGEDDLKNVSDVGSFDVFGVNEEFDTTFPNGVGVTSPFSYYTPPTGLTKGFRMAALGTSHFSLKGGFADNVITLGLTDNDLNSSGFALIPSLNLHEDGYGPFAPQNITYNTKSFKDYVLFDTGTEPYNFLFDPNATAASVILPAGSNIALSGIVNNTFSYSFTTTATDNLTYVENPTLTGGGNSILGLEYFLNNEFLIDFTNHRFGIKVR